MDILDTLKIGEITNEEIVSRMVADAVAGLDPTDPAYPDVIPGTILNDVYGIVGLELDRVYDRVHTELPASGIPTLASGEWLDQWAIALGLVRKDEVRATGTVEFTTGEEAPEVNIEPGVQVSTESAADAAEEITFQTTGSATIAAGGGTASVPIEALEPGAAGNVPANTVTVMETFVDDVESVRNPTAVTGGADVESDEALQDRIGRKLAGVTGPGNVADYENWCLEEPGVGFVTVTPNWAGPGTVRCTITDVNNDPVDAQLTERLQNRLDPGLTGEGFGQAPIGAVVTVATPDTHLVDVTAAFEFDTGYSLAGTGGTQPLEATLVEALHRYIDRLVPGADVVHTKLIAALVDVRGVADVTVTVPAGDVVIPADEVAALNDHTFTTV